MVPFAARAAGSPLVMASRRSWQPTVRSGVLSAVLGAALVVAEPFLFMPERMLAVPSGFTYEGTIGGLRVRGHYFVEPVVGAPTAGYRNWQNMTLLGRDAIFYGVAYLNGSYAQATIDPVSGLCTVFWEDVNCTGWADAGDGTEQDECDIVRTDPPSDPPVEGTMSLRARASAANPTLLESMATVTTIDGQTTAYDIVVGAYLADPAMPPTACGF